MAPRVLLTSISHVVRRMVTSALKGTSRDYGLWGLGKRADSVSILLVWWHRIAGYLLNMVMLDVKGWLYRRHGNIGHDVT